MRTNPVMGGVLLVMAALGWCGASARADAVAKPTVDYTADSIMESGGVTMKSTVYHSGAKQRRETSMGGQRQIMILRPDRGVSLVLMPQQQMYMEMPLGAGGGPQADPAEGDWDRTEVGTETVNGVQTTKYHVTGRSPSGETSEGTMWFTTEHIMVKMEVTMHSGGRTQQVRTELTNLKVGPLDPSLFEPPAGYRAMTMPAMPQ